jgi:hypothetical protein
VTASDPRLVIDAVWRIESPKLIAGLSRIVRDVGLAEDLAHDALAPSTDSGATSGSDRSAKSLRASSKPGRTRQALTSTIGSVTMSATTCFGSCLQPAIGAFDRGTRRTHSAAAGRIDNGIAMAFGPRAGLDVVETLASEPSLRRYHLLPSVRGDLLRRLDRFEEAGLEFERAASLTQNGPERELLLERARVCRAAGGQLAR